MLFVYFSRGWISNDNDDLFGNNKEYYLYTAGWYLSISAEYFLEKGEIRMICVFDLGEIRSSLMRYSGGVQILELCY